MIKNQFRIAAEVRCKAALQVGVIGPCLHTSAYVLKTYNEQRPLVQALHEFLLLLVHTQTLAWQLITVPADGKPVHWLQGTKWDIPEYEYVLSPGVLSTLQNKRARLDCGWNDLDQLCTHGQKAVCNVKRPHFV